MIFFLHHDLIAFWFRSIRMTLSLPRMLRVQQVAALLLFVRKLRAILLSLLTSRMIPRDSLNVF